MPSFEAGDIVRVPFPYTDRETRQRRPALVVSDGPVGEDATLLWVVMITSAANRPWPDDVPVPEDAGLPAPSVVRPVKIATIESNHADPIGKLPAATLDRVLLCVQTILGVQSRRSSA